MSKPKAKVGNEKNHSKTNTEEEENRSIGAVSFEAIGKNFLSKFGNDIGKLVVDQLRGEFQDLAVEAARQGALLAIDGVLELEKKVQAAEQEIEELKTEKEKLENQLKQKKVTNENLEKRIRELNDKIKKQEIGVEDFKRKLEEAENAKNKTENELRSKIKENEDKINKLKINLQMKTSAGNVAKNEISKLRDQIEEGKKKKKLSDNV